MGNRDYFSEKRLKEIERKMDRILMDTDGFKKDPRFILLDAPDLMDLFRISHNTARNWRRQGKMPYIVINKKSYVRLSDVEKMIQEHTHHRKKETSKPSG